MPESQALVFVYKADSGLFNTLSDIAHKTFSPDTYECDLCAITHGPLRMHQEWKRFIAQLDLPCEFLHRDELAQRYGLRDIELPAVYRRQGELLTPCLDAAAIAACADIEDLKTRLSRACAK